MTRKLLHIFLLLCLFGLGTANPVLAREKTDVDVLGRLQQAGWTIVNGGVLRRELRPQEVELFVFGVQGFTWKLQDLRLQYRRLQAAYRLTPTSELKLAIANHRKEIASTLRMIQRAKAAEGGLMDDFKESCPINFGYDAAAVYKTTGQGVWAEGKANFNANCAGFTGEVYAYAYSQVTVNGGPITKAVTDGPRSGANVSAYAYSDLNGGGPCESYAYASITSSNLNPSSYSKAAQNLSCPPPPIAVPGTIYARDFDQGGEGVAYHDTTAWNESWSTYRTEAVDMYEQTVVRLVAGEWIQYTVQVGTSALYALVAEVSAEGSGGAFHVEVDGTNVTGALAVPSTGGWSLWGSMVKTGVSLTAGRHVLRVAVDGDFDGFQSLRIVDPAAAQSPYGGFARSVPGTFAAADFDEGGELVSYHDVTAGCYGSCAARTADVDRWDSIVYGLSAGEWMEYTVLVAAAGTYSLQLQVASEGGGTTFHVELDGVDVTGPMTIPDTGGWSNFQTVTKSGVSLSAGSKVMRIVVDQVSDAGMSAGSFNRVTLN